MQASTKVNAACGDGDDVWVLNLCNMFIYSKLKYCSLGSQQECGYLRGSAPVRLLVYPI